MRTNLEVPLTSSMSDGNPTLRQGHNHEGTVPSTSSTTSSATIMKEDENKKTEMALPPPPPVKITGAKPSENNKTVTIIEEVIALPPIEVQALQEEFEVRLREGEKIILKEDRKGSSSKTNDDEASLQDAIDRS
ncbi:uncharacterized protein L199_008134 [Kwoniella botswanensis]|uniref:uncharacterized protein n=1 Tax=Kwoniella botswanensis TaxID=1268659 RepID=UPI00315D6185